MVDPKLQSPLTVQKVGDILRKAGIPQSKSSTTQVRGWRDTTHGFRAYKPIPLRFDDTWHDAIAVVWMTPPAYGASAAYITAHLMKVADALRAAGMEVRFSGTNDILYTRRPT
jgi:uncharacterized protein with von Willebrand factor type A (vWA) domain